MNFFDKFPQVLYDINKKDVPNYELVTNIFFRLKVVQEVLDNITAYYEYIIQDGDTPEILADKIYGDVESHWIILLTNNIIDAQHDWPLDYRTFNQYIEKKYDLISLAKSQTHHYEKVVRREESASGTVTETRFVINLRKESALDDMYPFDTYEDLPEDGYVETFDMGDGKTVIQTTFREKISNYDWEVEQNENKRIIKVIKPEYIPQIKEEFRIHLKNDPLYIRKLL